MSKSHQMSHLNIHQSAKDFLNEAFHMMEDSGESIVSLFIPMAWDDGTETVAEVAILWVTDDIGEAQGQLH